LYIRDIDRKVIWTKSGMEIFSLDWLHHCWITINRETIEIVHRCVLTNLPR